MSIWKAGFHRELFTPRLGMEMAGYAGEQRVAESVLDDLYASALVLQRSEEITAFIGVDVLAITGESVQRIRTLAEEQTGIPASNIMIAASHTHTGPTTVEIFSTSPDWDWLKVWEEQIAKSIVSAYNNLKPATISVGLGSDSSFMYNRRLLNSDNKVEMTIEQDRENMNLIPEGPIDPSVNIIRVDDEDGQPLAILVNYGNHVDITTGRRYSADYPGVMTKTVQKLFGDNVGVVFLNGACGDIQHLNHFDPDDVGTRERYWDHKGVEKMQKYGTILGCEVVRTALGKAKRLQDNTLVTRTKKIKVPVREINQETLDWAKETLESQDSTFREKILAKDALQVHALEGTNVNVELQAIAIGHAVVLAIPAEVFVEIGLQIKQQSPFECTFISELSNDWVGYLPTEIAFQHGGYETRPARSSKLIETADKMVIQASLELLQELKEEIKKKQLLIKR